MPHWQGNKSPAEEEGNQIELLLSLGSPFLRTKEGRVDTSAAREPFVCMWGGGGFFTRQDRPNNVSRTQILQQLVKKTQVRATTPG